LAIKAVEYFAPDPNFGIDQLSSFADWLQSYDPSQILGPQPQMFYVNWNQINQWIPDEQCGWGDILCGTRNALRALARGIIGGFAGIGSFIYWGLWNLAYYALKALFYLGAFLIKYLIIPIGKALMAIIANVFTIIKKAFCAYIQYVAPIMTIYRAVSNWRRGRSCIRPSMLWRALCFPRQWWPRTADSLLRCPYLPHQSPHRFSNPHTRRLPYSATPTTTTRRTTMQVRL
jgi:hypothetical protein